MLRIPSASLLTFAVTHGLLVGFFCHAARAETVVQVPLPGLLDARSVTTLTQGNLVVFTLPTDGGNLQNAFATQAVATLKGKPVENALPDDGKFAANARHPEVVLSFSNDADAASPQTHLVPPSGSFDFAVPAATYSKFFLFFNGAAGGTTIKVTFTYADGMSTANATVPDYYQDIPPADPVIFNLAANLAKWDKNTAINEANHHNITGVELSPTAGKTLTSVQVERGAEGNLVFWGATGIATSDIAGGAGAGGAGGGGGSSSAGAAGSGGAAGAGGTSSLAGAGMAGANAGAGGTMSPGTGGSAGTATSSGGGFTFTPTNPANGDAGCGCRLGVGNGSAPPKGALWLVLGALGVRRWRRKRLTS